MTTDLVLQSSDIFYIVSTIFVSIIWTMLIIAIYKLIKILSVAKEVTDYYYKMKNFISYFESIPEYYIEKIKNLIK